MTISSHARGAVLLLSAAVLAVFGAPTSSAEPKEPLAAWQSGVKISPVSGKDHHSMHSYFNTSPESPDGRWVLFYASTAANGELGELRVRERDR